MRKELILVYVFIAFIILITLYNFIYELLSRNPNRRMKMDQYLREPGSREKIISELNNIKPQVSLLGMVFNKRVLSKRDYNNYKYLKMQLDRQNLILKNDFINEISKFNDSNLFNQSTKQYLFNKFEPLYNRFLNENERSRMDELDIFKLNEYLKLLKKIDELENSDMK